MGLGARDSLRLEAGYPLYGHEFGQGPDGRDIPIFAVPLSRFAVSFSEKKGDFVGREALPAQRRELEARRKGEMDGPPGSWTLPKRIFPFRVTGRGIARQGHEVSPSGGGAPGGRGGAGGGGSEVAKSSNAAGGGYDGDGDDFLVWQRNFPYPTAISSVPEPNSLVLLALGAAPCHGASASWAPAWEMEAET